MVPKSPSWGNRAGRRLRIADDLGSGRPRTTSSPTVNKLVGEVKHGIGDGNPSK